MAYLEKNSKNSFDEKNLLYQDYAIEHPSSELYFHLPSLLKDSIGPYITSCTLEPEKQLSDPSFETPYKGPDMLRKLSVKNAFELAPITDSIWRYSLYDEVQNVSKGFFGVNEVNEGIFSDECDSQLSNSPKPVEPIYRVEFKSGRTDFYYCTDVLAQFKLGDLVIVEADRGEDLGKIVSDIITTEQVAWLRKNESREDTDSLKMIVRPASEEEVALMHDKRKDEKKALTVCLQKAKNRNLPMDIIDAEYQW